MRCAASAFQRKKVAKHVPPSARTRAISATYLSWSRGSMCVNTEVRKTKSNDASGQGKVHSAASCGASAR